MTTRRGFLGGLIATIAAPAVIRTPGLLMPVRQIAPTKVLTLAEYAARQTDSHIWDVYRYFTATSALLDEFPMAPLHLAAPPQMLNLRRLA